MYNSKTDRIMRPGGVTRRGYIQYHFYPDGRSGRGNNGRRVRYIHRLVAAAFIDPNLAGFGIDHLDDNNTNNYIGNLEIVTPKVNSQRAYDRGRRVPPSRKIVRIVETDEQFDSITDCARTLGRSVSAVAFALKRGTPTAGIHLEEVAQ